MNKKFETVAIIPARGGSKGIPGKNIVPLCGRPLIYWSIRCAQLCPEIEEIFVSTDAPEIADVAAGLGASIIWRPKEISGDTASSESALLHALDEIKLRTGSEPERVVFLQATSVLREPYELTAALRQFRDEKLDSLLCAAGREHAFYWGLERESAQSLNYDFRQRPRRQDRNDEREILIETGSFYITKTSILRREQNRLGGKVGIYKVPLWKAYEIDDPQDLPRIEGLMRAFQLDRQLGQQPA
ncbi:MAG: acylneuraminate cytidylyltransferase family protein [Oligoflexia bacterium]|nr:acylneuraminate cytidylyltransferase family protein [Oligoflexia bacterium]